MFKGSVCVWGPAGSPGKSTIAINLACELSMAGRSTLLIDLDTYSPSVGAMLGCDTFSPGLAAATRLAGQDRLDAEQIRRLAIDYKVGKASFAALCGLTNPARWPEVSREKTEYLIRVAEANFEVVIIDVASSLEPSVRQVGGVVDRNSAARTALAVSTQTLSVISADPIGVKRYIDSFEDLRSLVKTETLVANRLRASVLGNGARDQISATLIERCGQDVDWFIPDDAESLDRATLEIMPLALTKRNSNARQAIAKLARGVFALGDDRKALRAL